MAQRSQLKAERTGIFGGTFNPIHLGHLIMAQMALEKFGLDRVVFVPSHQPPHKTIRNLASPQHRLRMARLAVAGNPALRVSDVEVRRKGKSYSVDTVRHFRRRNPRAKLYFIVGQDSYRQLSTWKDIDEILAHVTFIAVNRPGYTRRGRGVPHVAVTMPGIEVSSSYIRGRVRAGKTVKYLVPDGVVRYIERNRLYR